MPKAYLDFKTDKSSIMDGLYENVFTITSREDYNTITSSAAHTWRISTDGGITWDPNAYGTLCTLMKGQSVMIMGRVAVHNNEGDVPIFNGQYTFDVSGNIRSLNTEYLIDLNNPQEQDDSLQEYAFRGLLKNSNVVDASKLKLPDTTLAPSCYKEMFYGCSNLKNPPELPATNLSLAADCYEAMFAGCNNLVYAPALPATTLSDACYGSMFKACTSLREAPQLPAGSVPSWAYRSMFKDCTALQTAPQLPALILTTHCYYHMFDGCTSLTTAPELPAINLPQSCYSYMFQNCSNLSYIKIHAENRESVSLSDWVANVADFGIFVKSPLATYPINDDSGVPIGWTIYDIGDDITDMYNVTVSVSPSDSGYVIGTGLHPRGSTVILKAIPYEGYVFNRWTDASYNIISRSNTYSFTLNEPISFYAMFITESESIEYNSEYFAIESEEDDNKVYITTSYVDESRPFTLYYKKNTGNWENIECRFSSYNDNQYYNQTLITTLNTGDKLYLGTDNGILKGTSNFSIPARFDVKKSHKISGNILSLIAYSASSSSTDTVFYYNSNYEVPEYCFENLFSGDKTLTDASNLKLPAIKVNSYSYSNMFNGCTSLLMAPTLLSATTLASSCYWRMFGGCTSLVTIPTLPATTLSDGCYSEMFNGCSSLYDLSEYELSAMTIPSSAYRAMFAGCTSLTYPPELPATTLNAWCYYEMFSGCSSLLEAPELPATTIPIGAYYSMFASCYSLDEAPELPATTLSDGCYERMFSDCISLTAAPVLYATTVPAQAYVEMFAGCTSLSQIIIYAQNYADEYNGQTSPGMINWADHSLFWWVWNVAPTGVFIKDPDADYEIDSINGVPPGWTIQNYDGSPVVQRYTIKLNNANTSAGTINMFIEEDGERVNKGTKAKFTSGTTVYIEAIANEDFVFTKWQKQNGNTLSTFDIYSFQVTESLELTAIWSVYSPTYYTVNVINDNPNMGTVTGAGSYKKGTIAYINSVAIQGYALDKVIDNNSGQVYTSTSVPITVNRDMSFTVYWKEAIDYPHSYLTIENIGSSSMTLMINIGYYGSGYNGDDLGQVSFNYSFQYKLGSENYWRNFNGNIYESTNELINGIRDTSKKLYITIAAGNKLSLRDFTANPWIGKIYIHKIGVKESGARYNIYGNVMSLYSKYKGSNTTDTYYVYNGSRIDNAFLISAGTYYYDGSGTGTVNSDTHKGNFADLFRDTSITNASHIILPATTLGTYCYHNMFNGCTSLTAAPELPATTLADYCYMNMFIGCTSLNYVKAMFTTDPNEQVPIYNNNGTINHYVYKYTHNWLQNAASSGTFVKNSSAAWTLTGASGIPSGWTVQTA